MEKFYEGFEVTFKIDGQEIPCLIDINLAQAQELLDSAYISGGWRGFRTNMLTYSLDVSGIDIDGTLSGYKQLRTIKRAKTLDRMGNDHRRQRPYALWEGFNCSTRQNG